VKEHKAFMEERATLVDAARESTRIFDKAVLTFGSAVFGFSIAFVKDVAPHPARYTIKWLGAAWILFALGLLAVLFSFLFSHKSCMEQIEIGVDKLQGKLERRNTWSLITTVCNYLCIAFLFVGLISWSVFAIENLAQPETVMSNPPPQPKPSEVVKKGYVLPPPPPRTPPSQPTTPTPPSPKK
jgi:uncharacterized membrane protein